jgi:predicted Zn finger-like uncharacterized protein
VQANCPQCAQRIVIDDARVPDRAFSVKCPKCQTTVKFPGRPPVDGPATVPPAAQGVTSPADPGTYAGDAAPPPAAPVVADEVRTQLMAQLRREMTLVNTAEAGTAGRALVAHPDRALAGAITVMLSRQGYVVDTIEDWEEAARLVEQGVYSLVLTTRVPAAQGKENVYTRIARLSPDNRRRLCLVLVGDDLKTGDGLQAFTANCDLVLNTREAPNADTLVRNTIHERVRLYQVYQDARHRHEAASTA